MSKKIDEMEREIQRRLLELSIYHCDNGSDLTFLTGVRNLETAVNELFSEKHNRSEEQACTKCGFFFRYDDMGIYSFCLGCEDKYGIAALEDSAQNVPF